MVRTAVTTAVAAAAVTSLPLPASALVPVPADVRVDGAALTGSTQADGDFTVTVAAPAGVKVKFKLDGTYIGQDSSAPYTLPVSTSAGRHSMNVRWDEADGRHEIDVPFTVAGWAPSPVASPTPTATPTATSTPTATPTPSTPAAGQTVSVATSAQLAAALKSASPGQTIALRDGTYTGAFVAAASGTPAQRITLTGSRNAVLTTGKTGSGYALHVTGDFWNISGLTVTRASKGIVLDGADQTVIDGVDVGYTGAEAVHLRKNSVAVIVRNSSIHDTGLEQPNYGEGIYIGSAKSNWASIMGSSSTPDRSDKAQILNNAISNTSAEGIDIKEGTTGGVITGNRFTNAGYSGENYADSWIDAKGNDYRVTGNTGSKTLLDAFQVHVALDGWGRGNIFRGNTVTGGVPGYEVSVQAGATGTVVACAPTTAARGLTNITCTP
jgi:hypothetical protein